MLIFIMMPNNTNKRWGTTLGRIYYLRLGWKISLITQRIKESCHILKLYRLYITISPHHEREGGLFSLTVAPPLHKTKWSSILKLDVAAVSNINDVKTKTEIKRANTQKTIGTYQQTKRIPLWFIFKFELSWWGAWIMKIPKEKLRMCSQQPSTSLTITLE